MTTRTGTTKANFGSITVELFAEINGTTYRVHGYGVKDARIANRLIQAWVAGAFSKHLVVKQATTGTFYAICETPRDYAPLGRTLNADLKRLGF